VGPAFHQFSTHISVLGVTSIEGRDEDPLRIISFMGIGGSRTLMRERDWAFFGNLSVARLFQAKGESILLGPYLGFEAFTGFYFFDMAASLGLNIEALNHISIKIGYAAYFSPSIIVGWETKTQGLQTSIAFIW